MGIAPGLGQISYSRNQGEQRKGRPATMTPVEAFAAANPILATLGNLLVGGSIADGNYDTTVVDTATGETFLVRTIRATTPTANADLAAQHAIDLNAQLGSILTATVNGTTAEQVDLVFLHAGRVYTVTTAVTGGGTMVFTEDQAPGGSALNIARFVRYGTEIDGDRVVQDLVSSSLSADVIAFLLTPLAEITNQASPLAADEDQYLAGEAVNAGYRGKAMAENVGGAGSNGGFVFVVVDTAGGDEIGEMRADADGTAHVVEASPAAGNDLHYQLSISLISLSTGLTVHSETFGFLSDASGTAAEVADGMVLAVDASALVTQHGCTSANVGDDLEVTAPVGFRLDIADGGGAGIFTVAEITPLVANTIRLPKVAARLDQDIAAGATGRIYINLPA